MRLTVRDDEAECAIVVGGAGAGPAEGCAATDTARRALRLRPGQRVLLQGLRLPTLGEQKQQQQQQQQQRAMAGEGAEGGAVVGAFLAGSATASAEGSEGVVVLAGLAAALRSPQLFAPMLVSRALALAAPAGSHAIVRGTVTAVRWLTPGVTSVFCHLACGRALSEWSGSEGGGGDGAAGGRGSSSSSSSSSRRSRSRWCQVCGAVSDERGGAVEVGTVYAPLVVTVADGTGAGGELVATCRGTVAEALIGSPAEPGVALGEDGLARLQGVVGEELVVSVQSCAVLSSAEPATTHWVIEDAARADAQQVLASQEEAEVVAACGKKRKLVEEQPRQPFDFGI